MQRKLASAQRVLELGPIENADAIELARINGWQCVVKKGEFSPGDIGVFFEIDAIPPDHPMFRFLWTPRAQAEAGEVAPRPEKFRIRTMKLRGALSQGLLLPLREVRNAFSLGDASEGDDLSALLGVEKYEPPVIVTADGPLEAFPSWVPKTDEARVQSAPQVLDELRGKPYAATLKLDGTSSTFAWNWDEDRLIVAGRNHAYGPCDNLYVRVARELNLEDKLRGTRRAVQGEIVGPGIQKNPLGLKRASFFAFNVFDAGEGRFLAHDEARAWLREREIPFVEEVERGDSFGHTLESLLLLAEGKYPCTSNEREGIVIRPLVEEFSPTLGGRLSFKAISNRFLLKEKD